MAETVPQSTEMSIAVLALAGGAAPVSRAVARCGDARPRSTAAE